MLHHAKAVARGARQALLVGDMPFMSYHVSIEQAITTAGRFLQEAGMHSVKLEGGGHVIEITRRLTELGIPVMGHLGLTPQFVHQMGGFKVQGKTDAQAARILADAKALEQAGAFSIVLEGVPSKLASTVTEALRIPTIGIGAGAGTDGQVLVLHDMRGERLCRRRAERKIPGPRARVLGQRLSSGLPGVPANSRRSLRVRGAKGQGRGQVRRLAPRPSSRHPARCSTPRAGGAPSADRLGSCRRWAPCMPGT